MYTFPRVINITREGLGEIHRVLGGLLVPIIKSCVSLRDLILYHEEDTRSILGKCYVGSYSERLVISLGRSPTPLEIIYLIGHTCLPESGATCVVDEEDRTFEAFFMRELRPYESMFQISRTNPASLLECPEIRDLSDLMDTKISCPFCGTNLRVYDTPIYLLENEDPMLPRGYHYVFRVECPSVGCRLRFDRYWYTKQEALDYIGSGREDSTER